MLVIFQYEHSTRLFNHCYNMKGPYVTASLYDMAYTRMEPHRLSCEMVMDSQNGYLFPARLAKLSQTGQFKATKLIQPGIRTIQALETRQGKMVQIEPKYLTNQFYPFLGCSDLDHPTKLTSHKRRIGPSGIPIPTIQPLASSKP